MSEILKAIFERRAIKEFDAVQIPPQVREQILDAARVAPSSFNVQPYRFYWVETPAIRKDAARLCMGQAPAKTASALIVAGPAGMDARGRIQRKKDFRIREESESGEMVFHPRMVRNSGRSEMGDSPGGQFLEDHRHGASGAAGTVQVGDQKRIAGL
jgi:nitroreductase